MEAGGRRGVQIERNTDNYRNMKHSSHSLVNFISPPPQPSLLPNPLALSLRVLSSLLPGPPRQILAQFDFFSAPRIALRVASLFHLLSSPKTHSSSSRVSSSSFISLCSLLSCLSLSLPPLPLSLRPIDSSCERRCLTVDSLTHIKADTL